MKPSTMSGKLNEISQTAGAMKSANAFLYFILIIIILFTSPIFYFIANRLSVWAISTITRKKLSFWKEALEKKKFISTFAKLIVVLFYLVLIPFVLLLLGFQLTEFKIFIKILIVLAFVFGYLSFTAVLDSFHLVYLKSSKLKVPILGYLQIAKISVALVVILLILAVIFEVKIGHILTGLAAFSAIAGLILKDVITSLFTGFTLAYNKSIQLDDWIEIPKKSVDGRVKEITMTTVVVDNFDNSIVSIPINIFTEEPFIKHRDNVKFAGRRIMKTIYFNPKSIKKCTEEILTQLNTNRKIKQFMTKIPETKALKTLNVALFKQYFEHYLSQHPKTNKIAVNILLSQKDEVPLEINSFSSEKDYDRFRKIRSEIATHLLIVLPLFDLELN